ncbi:unnamed protein product [Bursaphelenchus okinawaensis]|uniref:Flavin-containing monooxygenase n=1 Tax=Bursaphelenchus okinawaensis TaxID=465554 RepID=A0A811KWD8_9BILA|nr:unnamed protein product [Bursaphelenchus okinawaensis]CAG9113245.1 unnamed protein product [Bursaphelenchus okinawaensis]
MTKRVAIIGAGPSGLPSIRHALLYGVEPVCFEASDDVGGLWRYKPEQTAEGSVMRTTVINTSKEMTAYSDFPPPAEFANFMHNTQLLRYFQMYADHFNLRQYIKFHHRVVDVHRSSDYNKTGKWNVIYEDQSQQRHEELFDAVLLCTGHHTEPYWPNKWPGQDKFQGKIMHAHDYKDYKGHENKVVTVVGVGNSGFDIAVELSRIAKQVYVSTRRGTWIYNRIIDFGHPYDLIAFSRFIAFLRKTIPTWLINSFLEFKLNSRFDHAKYGLKPAHKPLSAHPTVNDELPNRLVCGTVIVKSNIKEFTETGLVYDDNTKVEPVDEVILSTGYSFGFPLAEGGRLIPVRENRVDLYKLMYPLPTAKWNNVAVIGLIQPIGSIMPISEQQCRLFFHALTGHTKLPSEGGMIDDINLRKAKMEQRYVNSRRHTIQVDYEDYMDELADLMDCKPNFKELLFWDPRLALKIFFGPNLPYTYRLNGVHKWHGARDAIFESEDRVLKGLRHRIVPLSSNMFGFYFVTIFIVIVALLGKFLL